MTTTTPVAPTLDPAAHHHHHPALVIAATTAAALGANLALWLAGSAAGAEFSYLGNGTTATATLMWVAAETVLPLLVGLGLATVLALRWRRILTVASVIGAVAALATGIGPLVTDFDSTTSSVCLALMHLVVAAAVVIGLRSVATSLH
ncbi:hypothetical protein ATM97_21830 [Nocardia sp. MH4]|uniref:DUF6069 family protein n=1 Tax=Nocardia sp. MH4 TaxID=1768677 RepID=UPI001C4F9A3A|nr:DUF6069 family protein [Nocardia sp. MH4]MBW0272733.1 hypothetical protein [Nocardia sp. MH4]